MSHLCGTMMYLEKYIYINTTRVLGVIHLLKGWLCCFYLFFFPSAFFPPEGWFWPRPVMMLLPLEGGSQQAEMAAEAHPLERGCLPSLKLKPVEITGSVYNVLYIESVRQQNHISPATMLSSTFHCASLISIGMVIKTRQTASNMYSRQSFNLQLVQAESKNTKITTKLQLA